jgi:hypothetical protein
MKRRIPTWTALAVSGLLAAASAFAQGGGENPRPAGDKAAGAHPSAPTDKQADAKAAKAGAHDMHAMHDKDMHAKSKATKHARKGKAKDQTASTSSAGTAAARGMRGDMARCTAMQDRRERADCARTAWEREHGTSG